MSALINAMPSIDSGLQSTLMQTGMSSAFFALKTKYQETLVKDLVEVNESNAKKVEEGKFSKEELRAQRKQMKQAQKAERTIKSKTKVNTFSEVVNPTHMTLTREAIQQLCFSQDSIQKTTSQGMLLAQLATNMAEKWKMGTHLSVVRMEDGSLVSLNNRRLYAARLASQMNANFEMPVAIFECDDRAPKAMLRGIIEEYKKGRQLDNINELASGIIENSYGHCIALRVTTRKGELNQTVTGYTEVPVVRA